MKELSGKDRIGKGIGAEWVLGADRECLLMVKSQGTEMDLSFCDPDLRFYEGQERRFRRIRTEHKKKSVCTHVNG